MIKRSIYGNLNKWRLSPNRKPLILIGARQVGKTTLARALGKDFDSYIEINFERNPEMGKIFLADLEPERILRDLSLLTGKKVIPGKTLLFLDEIGECPQAIASLRYFFEEMPALHLISAGSLIQFALEETGIPVGRVEFMHLYPLSFMEFLNVRQGSEIVTEIKNSPMDQPLSLPIHDRLIRLLGEYFAVGGMPQVVDSWIKRKDLEECRRILASISSGYIRDFSKYAKKHQIKYCEIVFKKLGGFLGRKLTFNSLDPNTRARELAPALDLLVKALVAHKVLHSSGNGVPLAAESNPNRFKVILADIALTQSILGLDLGSWILDPKKEFINRGGIVEAFVGQELIAYSDPYREPALFYWHREKKSSQAEIDYLTSRSNVIIPIEVKNGTGRRAKSLDMFLHSKKNIETGYIFSPSNYKKYDRVMELPLYSLTKIFKAQ